MFWHIHWIYCFQCAGRLMKNVWVFLHGFCLDEQRKQSILNQPMVTKNCLSPLRSQILCSSLCLSSDKCDTFVWSKAWENCQLIEGRELIGDISHDGIPATLEMDKETGKALNIASHLYWLHFLYVSKWDAERMVIMDRLPSDVRKRDSDAEHYLLRSRMENVSFFGLKSFIQNFHKLINCHGYLARASDSMLLLRK